MPDQDAVRRMVADRVTDEMLTKPVADLTEAEALILHSALGGPHADEIIARMDALPSAVPVSPNPTKADQ